MRTYGWMDGQAHMTKLIVAFRNFASATNIGFGIFSDFKDLNYPFSMYLSNDLDLYLEFAHLLTFFLPSCFFF